MFVPDLEGGLERDLRLPNTAKALDGRPLTVVWVCAGWDILQKLCDNGIPADEVLVTSEWDDPMPLQRYFFGLVYSTIWIRWGLGC